MVDDVRPTSTITLSDNALKVGETSLVTITFSEQVLGFDNDDLTVEGGTLSTVTTSDGGITWTALLTPTANFTDATNVITLDNFDVTDLAGNTGTGATDSPNYTIDTTRPTSTIVVSGGSAAETRTVTITFSEKITGFEVADLSVSAGMGTLGNLASSDGGQTWTGLLTVPTDTYNSGRITLDNTKFTDLAGNHGVGTTLGSYWVDTQRPTVTITIQDTMLAVGETTYVAFTFSEHIKNLDNNAITVEGGTLTRWYPPSSLSDPSLTWYATFTPTQNLTDTSNIITFLNSGLTDYAGNRGTGTTVSNTFAIDTELPTATISVSDTVLQTGETATVTITFSERVKGFSLTDLVVQNAALDGLVSADGITWTATLTPTAGISDAKNIITLENTGFTDDAGNRVAGTTISNSYVVETGGIPNTPAIVTGDLVATINEGSSYVLTTADLNFIDPDDVASGVLFTVSNQESVQLLVDGVVKTSFTGDQLIAGKVAFVHDGTETTTASFKVSVEDGDEDNSIPTSSTFTFSVNHVNDAPKPMGSLKGVVTEGRSYKLNPAAFKITDPDDDAADIHITVSSVSAGKLLLNGSVTTSFTVADLVAGKVIFVHDGSETLRASFKFAVEDGNEDGSTPKEYTFLIYVNAFNDPPKLVTNQLMMSIAEDASTEVPQKVATLAVSDPDTPPYYHILSLAGSDAGLFEIKDGALWLKQGVSLDYQTNTTLDVTVRVDDTSVGTSYEAEQSFKITVTGDYQTIGTPGNDRLVGTSNNDQLDGKGGNDVLIGGPGADRLDGGSGVDTASYETATGAVVASLWRPSTNSGVAQGDTYFNIEKLIGSSFADWLEGNGGANLIAGGAGNDALYGADGNDILIGGTGADKLYGGSGSDTASYADAKAGIIASLTKPSINTGDAKGDAYSSIEHLAGSSHVDKLIGNTNANNIAGYAGNDALYGADGNDILIGGTGADLLYGGSGSDMASYAGAKASITASLTKPSINTGDAKGDRYSSIENLTGSSHAD
ncbi:Ig-like domain-containing protein, partial [Shinella curvata]